MCVLIYSPVSLLADNRGTTVVISDIIFVSNNDCRAVDIGNGSTWKFSFSDYSTVIWKVKVFILDFYSINCKMHEMKTRDKIEVQLFFCVKQISNTTKIFPGRVCRHLTSPSISLSVGIHYYCIPIFCKHNTNVSNRHMKAAWLK